jgi:RNA polymerase-binding transcription factor DksA
MNKTLLEENKTKLLTELKDLRVVLNHETDSDQEIPGGRKPKFTEVGSEEGENASESEQFGNDLAVTEDLDVRLRQVEAALQRIDDGTYGTCLVGGEVISEDRLRAEPAAETCVEHSGNA